MCTISHQKYIIITIALLLATALLLTPAASHAQGPKPGDKVIFGGSFTLTSGESLEGDLVVFGGSVTVQQDAKVNGDVAAIGGTASIDGLVNGDIVAMGGVIELGPHAIINGDATAIGGVINRNPDAQVHGNIVETNGDKGSAIGKIGPDGFQLTPTAPGEFEGEFNNFPFHGAEHGPFSWLLRFLLGGMSAIAWTAILAALGVLLILLAPRPTERVANAIRHNILLAFGVGLGAVLLTVPLIILLAITICLIPVAIAIPFILLGAWLFGWLALGWLLGKEILKAANTQNATPIWEAIVGVAILTLLWRLPIIMPFIGGLAAFLVMFVAGNIAIGGVLLTRFGFRSYPAQPATAPTPTPPTENALPPQSTVPEEPEAPAEPQQPIIPPPPPPAE